MSIPTDPNDPGKTVLSGTDAAGHDNATVRESAGGKPKAADPDATVLGAAGDTVEDVPAATNADAARPPHAESGSSKGEQDPNRTRSQALDNTIVPVQRPADPTTDATVIGPLEEAAASGETVIPDGGMRDAENFFETLVEDPKRKRSPEEIAGLVIGDYQVSRELGRGGMGVVYQARHRKLDREVALKMILGGKHVPPEVLQRFIQEARAVAQLQHPGIVQIFDIGDHEGMPFFALEFVDGKDLQKDLAGETRDARQAAEMVETLCRSMQYAHSNGILHRDLKPANVLLDGDGNPKITDFGLAKKVDPDASTATTDGMIMGSPSYMPPEQARGEISSVTPRSDLYSLGAILYQMLTGRPPFISDKPLETVMQVINADPLQPRALQPGVPKDLETICMKALQKDQASRYQSCEEMGADLRRFLNGEPIQARPVSRLERAVRWCRRNPKIALPSGLAAFFIIATAGISSWAWNKTAAQNLVIAQERDNVAAERDEKELQRAEAERQKLLAQEARLQAERNEELARDQALLALRNIQLIVTEIDDKLESQPGTAELRVDLLTLVEDKWKELDVSLTGGIRGEAIPTLMVLQFEMAKAWQSLGRNDKADEIFEGLYATAQERVTLKGRTDSTRSNLAMVCTQWAAVRDALTGDPSTGDALRAESLRLLREILADPRPAAEGETPGPAPFQIAATLQQTLMPIGQQHRNSGRLTELNSVLEEISGITDRMESDFETNADWVTALPEEQRPGIRAFFRQNRNLARSVRAGILCSLGRTDEAVEVFDATIAEARSDQAARPDDHNATDQLARQLTNYGKYMLKLGRTQEGAKALGEANDLCRTLFERDPKDARAKKDYGSTLYYLATARDAQGLADDELVLLERSRKVREELVELTDDKSSKVNLMLTQARLGNTEEAAQLIEELSAIETADPDLRLDLARALAQIAGISEGDEKSERTDAAFAALNRCIEEGHSDPFPIQNEPDLAPIREDPRFAAVLLQLKQSGPNDQENADADEDADADTDANADTAANADD